MTITCRRKRTHGVHSQNTGEHLISYVKMNGVVGDSMMWCFRWIRFAIVALLNPRYHKDHICGGWSKEGQVTIYIINVRLDRACTPCHVLPYHPFTTGHKSQPTTPNDTIFKQHTVHTIAHHILAFLILFI